MSFKLTAICFTTVLFVIATQTFAADPVDGLEFRLASKTPTEGWEELAIQHDQQTLFVSTDVVVAGDDIERVSFYKDDNDSIVVGLELTDQAAITMQDVTSRNLLKTLAIVLNGQIVSAPTINSQISKTFLISGRFDEDDLTRFFRALVLNKLGNDPN